MCSCVFESSFKCPQCKSTTCAECLWKHFESNSIVQECPTSKCHYQLTYEELYTLEPSNFNRWLSLMMSKSNVKNRYDVLHSFPWKGEYIRLLYENMKLVNLKQDDNISESERFKICDTLKANARKLGQLRTMIDGEKINVSSPWLIICPTSGCSDLLINHKCMTCNKTFCKECKRMLEPDHQCDTQDVESINEIRSRCKMCPKCHLMTYRGDNCDQMWCTNCNHSFDWNTGELVDNLRDHHNPEYAKYMQLTSSEDLTDNCDVLIPIKKLEKRVGKALDNYYEFLSKLVTEHESIPDKIQKLIEIYKRQIYFFKVEEYLDDPELNHISAKITFKTQQRLRYLYNYEKLIATILFIGIGIINTATKSTIETSLQNLNILESIFNERMDMIYTLYDTKCL